MEDKARSLVGSSVFNDLRYIYKTYQECSTTDLTVCLKIKLLTSLDRASRSVGNVSIGDDIKLVRQDSVPVDESSIKSTEEIEESLPRSLGDKQTALNKLIFSKILDFFNTHTLQVKFPESEDVERSFEGRAKQKKNSWVMIPVILAGSMVPLAYGALALLAGKALIVSKLALVLASIIGIKKLVSSSAGHHEGSHEVVVSGGHGSGWGRTFESHDQAYHAQKPNQ
ncbi:uncharacterized protein LOC129786280 isoform X2 [Lutzomyia longipalpis]|nr:uncharacterized protein LOC129786280 isoform X2 [Lutzomyia longipalpis]